MSAFGVFFFSCLLIFLFTSNQSILVNGIVVVEKNDSMVPLMEPIGMIDSAMFVMNETIMGRRKLGSFRICALCTCCGGPRGLCLPSPCCYAINCNIPNRPFGSCSFTPKTCNCFGCRL